MSFQGGVNHFEDGPETPMEVKIFQVNPKTRGRLVGAWGLARDGDSLCPGDYMAGEASEDQVRKW